MKERGGLAVGDGISELLPLPVAGLMSTDDAFTVASKYDVGPIAKTTFGSPLPAPYMSLSFLALLVIPALKLMTGACSMGIGSNLRSCLCRTVRQLPDLFYCYITTQISIDPYFREMLISHWTSDDGEGCQPALAEA